MLQTLGPKHVEFLRKVASKPNSIHPLGDMNQADADAMANEGLLIKYAKAAGPMYAIGRYGVQYVKEHGMANPNDIPEMVKLAVDYVKSKGYTEEGAAEKIVEQEGVEKILLTQAEELRNSRQREVSIPLNEQGKPEIRFKG